MTTLIYQGENIDNSILIVFYMYILIGKNNFICLFLNYNGNRDIIIIKLQRQIFIIKNKNVPVLKFIELSSFIYNPD